MYKQKEKRFRDLVFGLFDVCVAMLILFPFFGQKSGVIIYGVSLLSLTDIAAYLKVGYYIVVAGIVIVGVLTLALQNCQKAFWVRNKSKLSLLLNVVGVFLFVISQQPYAATFLLIFLIVKVFMLIKWQ